ncbi:hypothetical protein EV178_003762 [Coemansia sp. RSA 1646]|nr:hypothetical protein EV178_003762 [Coemansia sp. RSA 1646]KAJ2089035.1 hypothetical protein IW138_003747 [Coemansia sp. RSA 986]KAJ2213472.1 hypothetical protein EV179_003791 [Coemansia sp. RSA 487]
MRRAACISRGLKTTITKEELPRAVRGMVDRIGQTERKHQFIVAQARKVAESYGYDPINTPILEYSSVFERTLGADSDVVGKELYKFLDSSQYWMTMRPEGTAAVNRAIISNDLEARMPQRLFYTGPMFRHERPQKGRLRQFEQFGIESLGSMHPAADVECIQMGWEFLNQLNVDGKLEVQLNTLGDIESRAAYKRVLKAYFSKHLGELSETSRQRVGTNTLRVLDSKSEADQDIITNAPAFLEHMSTDAIRHFDFVRNSLESLRIPYSLNNKLVRGLDYYQHTVWEITSSSALLGRSQGTVLAGGRYDGLSKILGGSKTIPGVGWGAGIERLALLLDNRKLPTYTPAIPVLIIPESVDGSDTGRTRTVPDSLYAYAMQVAANVRTFYSHGSYVFNPPSVLNHQQLSRQLSSVLKSDPTPAQVIIIGNDEMSNGTAVVRNTATQAQTTVGVSEIEKAFG